jgi:replicative DNA helicase
MIKIPGLKHITIAGQEARKLITDRRDGLVKSIRLPWQKLNEYTLDGLEWGTFTTWGGMSSSGKTAVISQLSRTVHDLNPDLEFIVLIFSFEMTAAKMLIRDIIASTKIHRETLLSARGHQIGEGQLVSVDRYLNSIKNKEVYLWEKPITGEDYVKVCREVYKQSEGKKLLVLGDHSLLFKSRSAELKERELLVNLSLDIMEIKNEGWSSHVLLSQLNREIERPERRGMKSALNYPGKSDLFASESLFQASDYVVIMHRPFLLKFIGPTYGPNGLSTEAEDTYFHILKSREGEIGICKMRADFRNMSILDN